MSTSTASELAYLSRALKAPRVREVATRLAERARDEGWDHETYLAAVLAEEVSGRDSHGGEARVKAARFPAVKTIDDFDFKVQPERQARRSSPTSPSSTSSPRRRTSSSSARRAPARRTVRLMTRPKAGQRPRLAPAAVGMTRKSHWPLGEPGGQDPNESLAARGLRACS